MIYKYNGKNITIPDREIEKLINSLELSQQEAIDLWLSDNGIEDNEEQDILDEKAKKVRIDKDIIQKSDKKVRKPVEKKVSDEKKELFSEILSHLTEIYGENVKILNENKLISVDLNGITFKIDLIQVRKKTT